MVHRPRQKPIELLDDDEVEALLAACNRGITQYRDRALIATLRGGALRCNEALALLVRDIDYQHRTVYVRHGKGGKARSVGLPVSAVDAINVWLSKRLAFGLGRYNSRFVFCTRTGERLADSNVRATLLRLKARAGIAKRVHPHGLRHTAAAAMRRRGVDLKRIQDQLGHTSLDTTSGYIGHLVPDELVAAVDAADYAGPGTGAPASDEARIAELTAKLDALRREFEDLAARP